MYNRARHIRSNEIRSVNATNCIVPNKNILQAIEGEIYALENASLNHKAMLAEFVRLYQSMNDNLEKLHCLSVSHWRAKDFWLEKYATLKAYGLTLSYPAAIFCKRTFFKKGYEQIQIKLPFIDHALAEKKKALIDEQAKFDQKTRQYNLCIKQEIATAAQETELVVATTELTEAQTEQMLLAPEKKNNTILYVAIAAGAFYLYTEDQKKKKK